MVIFSFSICDQGSSKPGPDRSTMRRGQHQHCHVLLGCPLLVSGCMHRGSETRLPSPKLQSPVSSLQYPDCLSLHLPSQLQARRACGVHSGRTSQPDADMNHALLRATRGEAEGGRRKTLEGWLNADAVVNETRRKVEMLTRDGGQRYRRVEIPDLQCSPGLERVCHCKEVCWSDGRYSNTIQYPSL